MTNIENQKADEFFNKPAASPETPVEKKPEVTSQEAPAPKKKTGRPKGSTMSEEAKKRISEAKKAWWAKQKRS